MTLKAEWEHHNFCSQSSGIGNKEPNLCKKLLSTCSNVRKWLLDLLSCNTNVRSNQLETCILSRDILLLKDFREAEPSCLKPKKGFLLGNHSKIVLN